MFFAFHASLSASLVQKKLHQCTWSCVHAPACLYCCSWWLIVARPNWKLEGDSSQKMTPGNRLVSCRTCVCMCKPDEIWIKRRVWRVSFSLFPLASLSFSLAAFWKQRWRKGERLKKRHRKTERGGEIEGSDRESERERESVREW